MMHTLSYQHPSSSAKALRWHDAMQNEGRKYTMHTRQNELNKWLSKILHNGPFAINPLAGDASFRRYLRIHSNDQTRIVMDAPPDKENIVPFLDISKRLAAIGVHTPAILAVEEKQGFILLEDLGDELLLGALSRENADALYKAAMKTLLTIQQCPTTPPALPNFDAAHMLQEMSLFCDWFLHAYLKLNLTQQEEILIKETFDWITEQLTAQPQVFIHRDYHSRNLMITQENNGLNLGVIDFQDAMRGPFTYDLVSLLKDCYIQWPREDVIRWLTYFYNHLSDVGGYSLDMFIKAFDICGLQRHLKVLGIFCRLYLRDHKPAYLSNLPLTFNYASACAERYSELHAFYTFLQERVYLPFTEINQA